MLIEGGATSSSAPTSTATCTAGETMPASSCGDSAWMGIDQTGLLSCRRIMYLRQATRSQGHEAKSAPSTAEGNRPNRSPVIAAPPECPTSTVCDGWNLAFNCSITPATASTTSGV